MFSLQRWILKSKWKETFAFLPIKGDIAKVQGIDIWYETFGSKKDPAFLLIMGGGCQGILWPDLFCQRLASLGFFVIRFDARDVGLSSYFDFEKTPYTLLDMAKDSIGLLDALEISKAHIMGTSMGGAIAQLISAYFKERVLSMTVMATSSDFRNLIHALEGKDLRGLPLSPPSKECLDWIHSLDKHDSFDYIRKVRKQFEGWEILNGPDIPFHVSYYLQLLLKTIFRQRSYRCILNHIHAIVGSVDLVKETEGKILVPSLVIQGEKDPIFPQDHGEHLATSIPKSHFLLLEKMGHNLNACFYDPILQGIQKVTANN